MVREGKIKPFDGKTKEFSIKTDSEESSIFVTIKGHDGTEMTVEIQDYIHRKTFNALKDAIDSMKSDHMFHLANREW